MENQIPNRLINESSLYLQQHAYNPVYWYPWSEEAFNKAQKEEKPIFLSIGYSTCHWCHVMERESFENKEIAELLNKYFVSIKVDREERPDIDHIYMMTCQLITGSGGWPLSVFLTPEQVPFFAGTYFPPKSRYGRIGFKDLLTGINNKWIENREEILENAQNLTEHLNKVYNSEESEQINELLLHKTVNQFEKRFDSTYGGFGTAPKFPSPHNLIFLLRYSKAYNHTISYEMVIKTLEKMRLGGIFDHIGFGFHRYSTDKEWLVPHFEKMLYDQAMLMHAYVDAYFLSGNNELRNTAELIAKYVLRDLKDRNGGFHSAEDADSEGVEGKFYVWSEEELKIILTEDELKFAKVVYNISTNGNYKDELTKQPCGNNIPHHIEQIEIIASSLDMNPIELIEKRDLICNKLFTEREKRIRPIKDDKILTDWNGLIISALAKLFTATNNRDYLDGAELAWIFIEKKIIVDDKLLHRYRNNTAGLTATIDDYAFLIWGLLELYDATYNESYLLKCCNLTNTVIDDFWDSSLGGFFFTPKYGENLIIRTKEFYDGAIPSGNSVMAINLTRLSKLTLNNSFDQYSDQIQNTFSSSLIKAPLGSTFLLSNYLNKLIPSFSIIIVGKPDSDDVKKVIEFIRNNFHFNISVFVKKDDSSSFKQLNNYSMLNGKPTFYLCKDHNCILPTNEPNEIINQLLKPDNY